MPPREVVIDESAKNMKETAGKIDDALSYSIKDGSWWAVMNGSGETYLSAFAVFLKATTLQIGLLGSIPQLLSSVLQLSAVKLTNKFQSRKKIVLFFVMLQALIWLAIIGISFVTKSVWVLIVMATLYFLFGAMPNPAWTSWMGDLVPEDKRGRYFGKRNRILGFASSASVIIGGLILHRVSNIDTFLAFSILFTIAFIARIISYIYLAKQFEPKVEIREPRGQSFIEFIKDMKNSNFGTFSLYSMLMMFAVYIAGPMMVVYWLQTLEMSYFQYMVIISTASITSFITISYWGVHADSYGNKTILWVSSYLVAFIPLMWYCVRFFRYDYVFTISIIIQIIAGFSWAGFNLSSSNFIFDSVKPINRVRLMSYYNALKGITIFIGGTLGGLLAGLSFSNGIMARFLPSGIFLVLFLSFFARLSVTNLFINKIREVKIVEHRPRFLHFITLMPVQGLIFDSVVGMNRTLKRFKKQLTKVENKLDYWEGDYKKKTKN